MVKLTAVLLLVFFTKNLTAQPMKDKIVKDSSFLIPEKYQTVYEGHYKNGKKAEGYFKLDFPGMEITVVDYYENGIAKYQYSKPITYEELSPGKTELTLKAIYNDGKIVEGREYIQIENGLTIKNWKHEAVNSFTVDMFAMNYYNRITASKKADYMEFRNLEDPKAEVRLQYKNKLLQNELILEGKPIFQISQITDLKQLPATSRISGFQKDKQTIFTATKIDEATDGLFREHKINIKLMISLDVFNYDNLDAAFEGLARHFSKRTILASIYKSAAAEAGESKTISYLNTGPSGEIVNGINWIAGKDAYYEIYKQGKIVKKEKSSLEDFQKVFQKYVNDF